MNPRVIPARAIAALAAATVLLAGCGGAGSGTGSGGGDSRFVAKGGGAEFIRPADRGSGPRAEGTTLDGGSLRLTDLRGKVVVVNFWASWCAPCRGEAPALARLYTDQKAKGVEFVGIDIKDAKEPAKAFVRTFRIGFPSLFDADGQVTLAFRDVPPNAVPSTLILDRQGRVAARIIGATTYSKLSSLVTQIAAEP